MTATLQRKLAEAQRDTQSREMTALRALRLSVARAGDEMLDLPLAVVAARQQRTVPEDMTDTLPEQDLIILLDCPDGATGAAIVSLPLAQALLQQQTMGMVTPQASDPRAFTDTDAALCAPLVEAVLTRAAALAEAEQDQSCFQGIRFGARAEDRRSLLLALRADRYRLFHMTLDIALGLHQAELILILPDTAPVLSDPPSGAEDGAARAGTSPMLDVPTQVQAVLARLRLSLGQLRALKPGDCLPLTRDRLDDTALVTITGRVLVRGRLGQMNGCRAVRLMSPMPIPRATGEAATGAFGAFALGGTTPQEGGVSDPALGADPGVPLTDVPLDAGDLANLSPQEAADQISELAGLSPDDLDPPADGLMGDDFPAGEIDLSSFADTPGQSLPE